MKFIKLTKASLYKELICWSGLVLYLILCRRVEGPLLANITYIAFYTLNFVWSYYFLFLFLFPNFFENRKLLFFPLYLILILLFIYIDFLHIRKLLPLFGGSTVFQTLGLHDFINHSIMTFSFVAVASIGSYLNWRSIKRVRERLEKEKDLVFKELNFIKEQFNSHFTLNFFSYCYNKILDISSSKAAESITNFTGILHYSIKNESNEYITVKEEIEYIENFVAVQKCITNEVYIELACEGDVNNYYILPGILSTVVENSFKHGVFSQKDNPIKIHLSISNHILTFVVKNKKTNRKPLLETGIGLIEMEEVIKLFYPGKHHFKVEQNDYDYSSQLNLELTPIA